MDLPVYTRSFRSSSSSGQLRVHFPFAFGTMHSFSASLLTLLRDCAALSATARGVTRSPPGDTRIKPGIISSWDYAWVPILAYSGPALRSRSPLYGILLNSQGRSLSVGALMRTVRTSQERSLKTSLSTRGLRAVDKSCMGKFWTRRRQALSSGLSGASGPLKRSYLNSVSLSCRLTQRLLRSNGTRRSRRATRLHARYGGYLHTSNK